MNRYSHLISFGIVGVFFLSIWAGMLYMGPKWEAEDKADFEKEEKELKEKNERYIRLMTMRMALENARKEEIKQILAEKARKDALKNGAAGNVPMSE